jgi:hypothetical protein
VRRIRSSERCASFVKQRRAPREPACRKFPSGNLSEGIPPRAHIHIENIQLVDVERRPIGFIIYNII